MIQSSWRLRAEIDPAAFRRLARELDELAELAQKLLPRQHQYFARLQDIRREMEQLDELASRPEFRRLSAEKRVRLRKNLIQSRDQLIETVQSAPTPTSILQ